MTQSSTDPTHDLALDSVQLAGLFDSVDQQTCLSACAPSNPPSPPPGLFRTIIDPASPAHPDQPGGVPRPLPVIGEYELLEELGRGGMGIVYEARHRRLHRLVALKMIHTDHGVSATALRRFRIEAEAVAQLEHPAIVPIY